MLENIEIETLKVGLFLPHLLFFVIKCIGTIAAFIGGLKFLAGIAKFGKNNKEFEIALQKLEELKTSNNGTKNLNSEQIKECKDILSNFLRKNINVNNKQKLIDISKNKTFSPLKLLQKCNLEGAKLSKLDFTLCDLQDANLSKSKIKNTILKKTNLYQADFSNAIIERSNFSDANLWGAKFEDSIIIKCNFSRADIRSKNLKNAVFKGLSCYSRDKTKFPLKYVINPKYWREINIEVD